MNTLVTNKRNSKEFYVYVYLDPRRLGNHTYGEYSFAYEPFYVGKGRKRRAKNIRGRQRKGSPYLHNKLKSLQRSENSPIILKVEKHLLEKEAFNLEIELISLIGRKNKGKGPLVNLTDGGDGGSSGAVISEETRRKIGEASRGRKHTMSEEEKRKMGDRSRGRKHSGQTKKKMSEIHKIKWKYRDRKFSNDHKKKLSKSHRLNWILMKGGNTFATSNLKEFCEENELSYSCMGRVAFGGRIDYKGWTIRKAELGKRRKAA